MREDTTFVVQYSFSHRIACVTMDVVFIEEAGIPIEGHVVRQAEPRGDARVDVVIPARVESFESVQYRH